MSILQSKQLHIPFLNLYFVGNTPKERISKRVFQENKATFLTSIRTCTYQRVRNVRFSENLACFFFLKHPFWDSPYWLVNDDFLWGSSKIVVKLVWFNFVRMLVMLHSLAVSDISFRQKGQVHERKVEVASSTSIFIKHSPIKALYKCIWKVSKK